MIPPRPGIVIRSQPEKGERKTMPDDFEHKPLLGIGRPEEKASFQASSDYAFTLYTNMNKCKYSSELLELVERNGLIFEAKDVSRLSSLPVWLKGTPVIEFNGEGYCGDLAFNFVNCLITHFQNISSSGGASLGSGPGEETVQEKPKSLSNGNGGDSDGCSFSKAFSKPLPIHPSQKKPV